MFLGTFQHANIRTPRWLGYLVQRPESHSLHHARGVHHVQLLGPAAVRHPVRHVSQSRASSREQNGYYDGASARIREMLAFKDVAGVDYDPSLTLTRKPSEGVS